MDPRRFERRLEEGEATEEDCGREAADADAEAELEEEAEGEETRGGVSPGEAEAVVEEEEPVS